MTPEQRATHANTLLVMASLYPHWSDACRAGADALRLLPLAMAGDLCRGGDCQHPGCESVRALLAPTEPTR